MNAPSKPLPLAEFVILLAMMVSIVAMSTDVMLPALDVIGRDLQVADPNDTQLVVSSLFLGFAVGQVVAGPLSDSFGRKPVIYLGYAVFIVGCLLSIFSTGFTLMLVGRVLQGLGAACPRIVTLALVRRRLRRPRHGAHHVDCHGGVHCGPSRCARHRAGGDHDLRLA